MHAVSMPGTLAVSPLKIEQRRMQDVLFGFIFVVLTVAVVAITFYSASNSENTLAKIMNECTNNATQYGRVHNGLLGASGDGDNLVPDLLNALPFYVVATLVLSILVGIFWMCLLRQFAKPVVYVTLISKGCILIALGIYLSSVVKAGCSLTQGDCSVANYPYILCLCGVLYFLVLFCLRRRIELTAKLLEQAVQVVTTHPGLFLVSGGLLIVKVLFLLLSLTATVFLILSQTIVTLPSAAAPGVCDFAWRLETADKLMYAALAIFFYWSVQFWLTVKFYIVSMVTGIWYFENGSLAAQEGSLSTKDYVRAPVCTAVKTAFTTAFGTIAFASLIITLCEWLKRLARREARNGLLGCLIACCVMCIVNCIEFLTRFALVYAALTGDNLCASGRTFLDSCNRHGFLKVYVVDGLAAMTLQFGAIIFSLLVTAFIVGLVDVRLFDGAQNSDDRTAVLGTVGGIAFIISAVVLFFISSILLYIVDAAYSCVVLDLDNHARVGTFHRPAIAQAVMFKLNRPDMVVMQPTGGAAYAVAQPVTHPPVAVAYPIGQPVASQYARP